VKTWLMSVVNPVAVFVTVPERFPVTISTPFTFEKTRLDRVPVNVPPGTVPTTGTDVAVAVGAAAGAAGLAARAAGATTNIAINASVVAKIGKRSFIISP